MHFSTLFTCAVGFMSTTGWAQYTLQKDYMTGGNFLDQFSFWTAGDPTNGFVEYVSQSDAQSANLTSCTAEEVRLSVDSTSTTTTGRKSVRLTSNDIYQSGLVILDLEHMPGGICGTWPAFWMVGPDWPNQGEIDIIEGVNEQTGNQMTLHTGDSCSISYENMLGTIVNSQCQSGNGNNAGCGISTDNAATYGDGFNGAGGGVYATEWTSSGISVYFFPRGQIPSDITNKSPDPSSWKQPLAKFGGGGYIASSFKNQQIVFDTTFCGDWAGQVWSSGSCATKASSCEAYVGENPEAFAQAYWTIKGLQVYQNGGGSSQPSSAAPAPSYTKSAAPQGTHHHHHGHKTHSTFAISTAPAKSSPAWAPSFTGSGPIESGAAPTYSSPPETSWGGAQPTWGGQPPAQESGWSEQSLSNGGFGVGQPAPTATNYNKAQETSSGQLASEHHNDNGAYDVGVPMSASVERRDHRVRHLRHHKNRMGRF